MGATFFTSPILYYLGIPFVLAGLMTLIKNYIFGNGEKPSITDIFDFSINLNLVMVFEGLKSAFKEFEVFLLNPDKLETYQPLMISLTIVIAFAAYFWTMLKLYKKYVVLPNGKKNGIAVLIFNIISSLGILWMIGTLGK